MQEKLPDVYKLIYHDVKERVMGKGYRVWEAEPGTGPELQEPRRQCGASAGHLWLKQAIHHLYKKRRTPCVDDANRDRSHGKLVK